MSFFQMFVSAVNYITRNYAFLLVCPRSGRFVPYKTAKSDIEMKLLW